MKKRVSIIILIIVTTVIVIGITYSWWDWSSSNNNVNFTMQGVTVTYNGGTNISGIKLLPVSSKEKGVTDNIAIYKEITVSANREINFNLFLDINTLGSGLKNETLKWEIYKGNVLINNGNFKNANANDTINLMLHEQINTTTATYKLYIYIDGTTDNPIAMESQNYNFTLRGDANDNPNEYVVTLNSNGGNSLNNIILVTYGQNYGTLPTPTKSGYTFLGWNGKNLVNIANHNVTFTSNYYKDNIPTPKYILNASSDYTLSFNYNVNSASKSIFSSVGYGTTGFQRDIKSGASYTGNGTLILSFTTPDTFSYNPPYVAFRFVRMGSPGDANVDISNIQLEEGSSATPFEPYYIQSTTTVVQNEDHTLTAVWS